MDKKKQGELSPKQQYEQKKKMKEIKKSEEKQGAKIKNNLWLYLGLGVIAIVVIIILITSGRSDDIENLVQGEGIIETQVVENTTTNSVEIGVTEKYSIQGQIHITPGSEDASRYNSNPPTSGWHYAQAPNWGYYRNGLKDEEAIHGLEHGGIWISYRDLNEEELNQLHDIQRNNRNATLLSPREGNDARIAVASWGRLMHLDTVDVELIEQFIKNNKNNSPEPFAR
jgi:hypothetical protein